MICKWCGAGVSPAEKKCPRCGREIPALSDCGGFYDVAPRAPRNPASPQVAAAPVVAAPVVQKKSGKGGVVMCLIGIVAVTALVIGLMLAVNRVSELESRLHSLESDLEEAYETLDRNAQTTAPTNPTDPTDPTEPDPTDPSDDATPSPTAATEPPEAETTAPLEDATQPSEQKNVWSASHDWNGDAATITLVNTVDSAWDAEFVCNRYVDSESGQISFTYENVAMATSLAVTVGRTEDNCYKVLYKVTGDGLGEYPAAVDMVAVNVWNDPMIGGEGTVTVDNVAVVDGMLTFDFTAKNLTRCQMVWNGNNGECLTLELTGLKALFDAQQDASET